MRKTGLKTKKTNVLGYKLIETGKSIDTLAKEIGVHPNTVSDWIRSRSANLEQSSIDKLAAFFHCSCEQIRRWVWNADHGLLFAHNMSRLVRSLAYTEDHDIAGFSKLVGIPTITIYKWCEGHCRRPSHDNLEKLANYMGITSAELRERLLSP